MAQYNEEFSLEKECNRFSKLTIMNIIKSKSVTLVLTILGSILLNTGYGQLYINGKDINTLPSLKIIELAAESSWHLRDADRKNWYFVEYGQTKPKDDIWKHHITDSSNVEIPFANPVSIANFIVSKGWQLISVNYYHTYTNTGEVKTPHHLYTFVKKD